MVHINLEKKISQRNILRFITKFIPSYKNHLFTIALFNERIKQDDPLVFKEAVHIRIGVGRSFRAIHHK